MKRKQMILAPVATTNKMNNQSWFSIKASANQSAEVFIADLCFIFVIKCGRF